MQNSGLNGANAQTAVPQVSGSPGLNPYKTGNEARSLQQQGMGQSQAMTTAAGNPNNGYAAGGPVQMPPSPQQQQRPQFDPKLIQALAEAVATTPAMKSMVQGGAQGQTQQMMQKPAPQAAPQQQAQAAPPPQPQTPMPQQAAQPGGNQPQFGGYAKGGPVHQAPPAKSMHDMPLKDVIKLLASHPGLGGQGMGNGNAPMQGSDMRTGGAVKKPVMGNEGRADGNGLLNMNSNVGAYAMGGDVDAADGGGVNDEIDATGVDEDAPAPNVGAYSAKNAPEAKEATPDGGLLQMAAGGGLEGGSMQEDSTQQYEPDGTPIIQNADGTEAEGNVNQMLGRPDNAPTLGTGQTPVNGVSKNASNSIGEQEAPAAMAKGGEAESPSAPPPGALSKEVADDVPANLSEGEFVFSADAVRYYGLQFLNGLMDHARQELSNMSADGSIRSPGDGKNPDEVGGQFMQDEKPNMQAYADKDRGGPPAPDDSDDGEEPAPSGILKQAAGGNIAPKAPYGLNAGKSNPDPVIDKTNPGTSFPAAKKPVKLATGGGLSEDDFAKGGIVSSTMSSLTPKKSATEIPEIKTPKLSATGTTSNLGKVKPPKMPKMKKGGLLKRDIDQTQSYVG